MALSGLGSARAPPWAVIFSLWSLGLAGENEFMRTNEAVAKEHRTEHLLVIPRPLEENSGSS